MSVSMNSGLAGRHWCFPIKEVYSYVLLSVYGKVRLFELCGEAGENVEKVWCFILTLIQLFIFLFLLKYGVVYSRI